MRTQIWVNDWYCIHNIKYLFVNVKNKMKSNQKPKLNITYNIEVKDITINSDEYMTDWNGNELY